jgi:chitin disaccharide deacetylase
VTKHLIVNADDFNLTEGVTRGILHGCRHGIITSTTVMVNLPGLAYTRDLAHGANSLGLGLHVNLTLGRPVLASGAVPSLVDEAGRFVRDRTRVGEAGAPSEIRAEIAAQARRFEEVFGRLPTHLDTHYHMHRLPRIFEAVLDIAAELGAPVRALTPEMAALIRGRGLSAPDRLVGDVGPAAYWTPETLGEFIGRCEEGVTELMCHPGYADEALMASSYNNQREGELRGLCDPQVKAAIAAAGIELISYRGLAAASRA